MQSGHHVVAWGARFIGHILGKKSPCFASSLSWRWSAVHASNLILWKGQVHPILCEKIRPRELVFVTGKDQLHFSTGENSGDWTVSVFCSPSDLIGSDQKKKSRRRRSRLLSLSLCIRFWEFFLIFYLYFSCQKSSSDFLAICGAIKQIFRLKNSNGKHVFRLDCFCKWYEMSDLRCLEQKQNASEKG